MDRRTFLATTAFGAFSAPLLSSCQGGRPTEANGSPSISRGAEFLHGVASGDPLQDRVILWTRVTPENEGDTPLVTVQIAEDPEFFTLIHDAVVETSQATDFTVKVDADGLQADRAYWYRFRCGDATSSLGRTRTLPAPDAAPERLRFAVTSCSSYPHGYFGSYRMMANRSDLDFILHLGDYIYEYEEGGYGDGAAIGRPLDPPHEIVSLSDYRRRYALYRRDADLQECHRVHPFIAVWDDHETANDSWKDGAENHNDGEGDWAARKAAGIQAYFEWLPIRPFAAYRERIYRRFQYGQLADFLMLDTRIEGRDEQVALPIDPARHDTSRTILGAEQKSWLKENLAASTAQWKFLGQQVMMGQLQILELQRLLPVETDYDTYSSLLAINMDQWDGYAAEREELLDFVRDQGIENLVVLTGDIHSSWANELYTNPAVLTGGLLERPLAVEFVTPSVTSPGFPAGAAELVSAILPLVNPHIRYTELQTHGFILLDVNRERTQAEYYYHQDIRDESLIGVEDPDKTKVVSVYSGDAHLVEDEAPSRPNMRRKFLAPLPRSMDGEN